MGIEDMQRAVEKGLTEGVWPELLPEGKCPHDWHPWSSITSAYVQALQCWMCGAMKPVPDGLIEWDGLGRVDSDE